jgi:putative ABC transport system permease protein
VISAVRETVRGIDPNQTIDSAASMDERLDAAYREPRSQSLLVLGFAMTALALTILGIYGVMSSEVIQRTREIGIRIAVGAEPSQVRRLMVRRSLRTVIAGIAVGLAGAAASTRFVAALLFGVKPLDIFVFVASAAAMAIAGLLASYLPARRAAAVNPVEALRAD